MLARYKEVGGELRFFFITSQCTLVPISGADALARANTGRNAAIASSSSLNAESTPVIPIVSEQPKCIRCWHHRPDVGSAPEHPEICGRCVGNLPGGPGEVRRYF